MDEHWPSRSMMVILPQGQWWIPAQRHRCAPSNDGPCTRYARLESDYTVPKSLLEKVLWRPYLAFGTCSG